MVSILRTADCSYRCGVDLGSIGYKDYFKGFSKFAITRIVGIEDTSIKIKIK
jgi:hypothetical protein